jgi:hypothetical protein
VIDPLREELMSLNEARNLFPRRRRNKRPDLSCLYRWTSRGCRGVVLESMRVGGTRCTSREACARFIRRLTEIDRQPVTPRSPAARGRHNQRASQELDRLGI